MLRELKVNQEIQVLRVLEEFKVHLGQWVKLANEAAQELTEPVECLENLGPRVTEGLMVFQVFPVRRGTGVTKVPWAHLALLVKMEKGEKMERLDPEGCPVNLVNEDCWDLEVLLVPQVNTVLLVLMDPQDPKETWDLKVNLDQQVSKEFQDHKVSLVHKARSVPLVTRDHMESLVYLDYLELMDPQVTLEKKDHPERRAQWVQLVPRVLLVILDLVVSRVPMVSED